jgi:hypothetical protein
MAFYSGPYTATYGDVSIGMVEDGFSFSYRRTVENIVTDAAGDSPLDAVHRGVSATLSFILSEYDKAILTTMMWPFIDAGGSAAEFGELGQVGRLDTTMAKQLVMTACTVTNTPYTITFPKVILSPDFDVTILFANRHRKVPMQLTVYPTLISASTTNLQCKELQFFSVAAAP